MQVLARSSTSARPRAASPGIPVSDVATPSPSMTYVRSACSSALEGSVNPVASMDATPINIADLTKGIGRHVLEPGLRTGSFAAAHFAGTIQRTRGDRLDFGEHSIACLINARLRDGVAGGDRVVASPDQGLHLGRFA